MTLSAISGFFVTGAAVLVVVLISLGFMLTALDRILDSRDREDIRKRAEAFWFRTASLEILEQFQLALRSRYAQMRRLQPTFLLLFLLVAIMLALWGAVSGASWPPADIKQLQKNLIKQDLDIRYNFLFAMNDNFDDDPAFGNSDGECTIGRGFDNLREASRLGEVKASLDKFLNESNSAAMRMFNSLLGALVPLIVALPLAAGLIVSFNVTLWLLSRLTQSRLAALFIVTADILLALVMPTIVSAILLTVLVFGIVFSLDALPDYALFQNPTWTTLTVSSVSILLGFSLGTPVVAALFTKEFVGVLGWSYVLSTLEGYVYQNAKIFLIDIGRVLRFDLAITPVETLINYAIGIDLLFSLFYIVPCLSLVLMQRSPTTRRLFLNLIQWIAEHPKGPLVAVEKIVTSFGRYLAGVVKRG